jgi:hypothetical protein
MGRIRRPLRDHRRPKVPRLPPVEENGARPISSPTAYAAEAIRTGVLPNLPRHTRVPVSREDETMRVGDPDDSGLDNEYVGDDLPGGDSPTPDQNLVDDIGRAYGLQEEDTGALRSGAEVLERRDKHRTELAPPSRSRR